MRIISLYLASIFFGTLLPVSSLTAQDPEAAATEPAEVASEKKAAASDFMPDELSGDDGAWRLPQAPDDEVRIGKIYEFLNDPEITKTGKDKSLAYEFKYFNHGAITERQKYNRQGQYFVVTWSNGGPPADYQLRLDYRQAKTREEVRTLTIPYPNARGTFKGTFSVTGDQYYLNGSLLSWRISVVRNGQIVAEERSFVW